MAGGKFFGTSNGSNLVHKAFLRIPNLGDRTRANACRGRASGNFAARLSHKLSSIERRDWRAGRKLRRLNSNSRRYQGRGQRCQTGRKSGERKCLVQLMAVI